MQGWHKIIILKLELKSKRRIGILVEEIER
jgi:hypothetical protein